MALTKDERKKIITRLWMLAGITGRTDITWETMAEMTDAEVEDVGALIDGCLNVMRYLKMLPGPAQGVEHPVWISKVETVASEQTGIFYPLAKRGTYVEKGMKIGYVTDYLGKTTYEARAPAAGVVLYICAVPSMKKGDTIANIGVVAGSQ